MCPPSLLRTAPLQLPRLSYLLSVVQLEDAFQTQVVAVVGGGSGNAQWQFLKHSVAVVFLVAVLLVLLALMEMATYKLVSRARVLPNKQKDMSMIIQQ